MTTEPRGPSAGQDQPQPTRSTDSGSSRDAVPRDAVPRDAVPRDAVPREDTASAYDGTATAETVSPGLVLPLLRTVVLTPVLVGAGWLLAWQAARRLPGVPDWDSTFTWAPIELLFLGPALVLLLLLGLPAWVRPRSPRACGIARVLVLVGCQSVVTFQFGFGPEWWRTGGFPPTLPIVTLELAAAAVALVPSLLLVRHRDDGTSRGWRAYAMVSPALVVVLVVAVVAAVRGVPAYDPYPVAVAPASASTTVTTDPAAPASNA